MGKGRNLVRSEQYQDTKAGGMDTGSGWNSAEAVHPVYCRFCSFFKFSYSEFDVHTKRPRPMLCHQPEPFPYTLCKQSMAMARIVHVSASHQRKLGSS